MRRRFELLLQLLVNGLIVGSVFAVASLGYALIYNTTRIFHIAYSVLYVLPPYCILGLQKYLKISFFHALPIAIGMTVLLSVSMELAVYRPLMRKKGSSTVLLISSIGMMIVIVNAIAMFFGNETKVLRSEVSGSLSIGNIIILHSQLFQLVACSIVIGSFLVFLKFGKFGIMTRAMRDDDILCSVFGMNLNKMRLVLFALSGLFAAIAGALVAYDVGADPYAGMPMLLNAVVALIIGGMGRFEAPILGAFIIGILQALVVWAISSRWQDAVTFALLILFLLFRPQGIMGEKRRAV